MSFQVLRAQKIVQLVMQRQCFQFQQPTSEKFPGNSTMILALPNFSSCIPNET